jgi:hypothetical protein
MRSGARFRAPTALPDRAIPEWLSTSRHHSVASHTSSVRQATPLVLPAVAVAVIFHSLNPEPNVDAHWPVILSTGRYHSLRTGGTDRVKSCSARPGRLELHSPGRRPAEAPTFATYRDDTASEFSMLHDRQVLLHLHAQSPNRLFKVSLAGLCTPHHSRKIGPRPAWKYPFGFAETTATATAARSRPSVKQASPQSDFEMPMSPRSQSAASTISDQVAVGRDR